MPQAYSPGPWRVGDAGHTVFGPPNGQPSPETIATVRDRANAQVVAAAPEYEKALQVIREWADREIIASRGTTIIRHIRERCDVVLGRTR